jgi:predicted DNA-binding transcriptional regulator AlpA
MAKPDNRDHVPADPAALLTSALVRQHLGNVSEMTIWRWTYERDFPRPDVIIARRKFWRLRTIEAWIAAQRADAAA